MPTDAQHDIAHSDLRELLALAGMPDHARPQSPHEVFQEALGVLRQRLAIGDRADHDRSCLAQEVEYLACENARLEPYEEAHATCVQWTSWSITEADSNPSDPGVTYCTDWYIGVWPIGAAEPLFSILVGADRKGDIAASRIAGRLRSEINTVYLRAQKRAADEKFARKRADVKAAAERLRGDLADMGLLYGAGSKA